MANNMDTTSRFTVHEILDIYGPILASDADDGLLVQVNESHFNIWRVDGTPGIYKLEKSWPLSNFKLPPNRYFNMLLDQAKKILTAHIEE